MRMLRDLGTRLLQSKSAATAVIYAISLPVVIGGSALAIDVASFRLVQSRMQSAVDAAALAAVMQIDKKGPVEATATNMVASNIPAEFGIITNAGDVTVGTYSKAGGFVPGNTSTANAVRVIGIRSPARNNGVGRIFALLWGSEALTVQTEAIAARPSNVFYEPPEGLVLDSEAGDFNEMYAYCYDMKGTGDAASRRSQMTLIANNLPIDSSGNYTQTTSDLTKGAYTTMPAKPMPWPNCDAKDQSLSFRLKNYRHRKNYAGNQSDSLNAWKNSTMVVNGYTVTNSVIDYYTDTQITNGVETFDSNTSKILETVLCDTSDQCKPGTSGTKVPTGKNRYNTKSSNTAGCSPGKFVYFGFEDRPGVNGVSVTTKGQGWLEPGWTDYDYNDIAVRMKCPSSGKLADPYPRLVG